ncbi:MAG: hypothetical protein OJF49_003330 [Ktedonobacterales bacterium]|nr:MAG: hypothetical protein OJF49_003330 [Ktedonobacterales bacterium]
MGTSRNPGMLAVTAGVALAVLFALLGVTGVLDARIGFGMAVIALVVSALIYIFYSRADAVEKTGYGALLFIIAIAFIIPLLIVNQQQAQATQASAQYQLTLQRGAALFATYCASCHGFQGNGKAGPKLNNNDSVNKLTTNDLSRIISAGVPNPDDLTKFSMPAWSEAFGGPLTDDDIAYLVALIRSSDPQYRATNNLGDVNGFSYVLGTLTDPTQIAQYEEDKKGGSKPPLTQFTDLSTLTTVHMDAEDAATTSTANWGWVAQEATSGQTSDIIVKAGTTIIFGNKSSAPHNVFSGNGTPDGKFGDPNIIPANSTQTFTVTLTAPGEYPFYCGIHPAMVGWITVVP